MASTDELSLFKVLSVDEEPVIVRDGRGGWHLKRGSNSREFCPEFNPDKPMAKRGNYCPASHWSEGWICTREVGHEGLHVAHDAGAMRVVAEWHDRV